MSNAINKLLAMVNRDNAVSLPSSLTESQVAISVAAANTNAKVSRDTQVTLTAKPGAPYRNKVTVYYNRIDLAVLFKSFKVNVGIDVQEDQTTDDLLPLINAKYGTDFEVGDIVQAPLTVGEGERVVKLVAAEGNLVFVGEVNVSYDLEAIDLDSVVLTTTLTGFNYPNSDTSKGQGAIYSFNLDGSAVPGDFWGNAALGAVTADFVSPFNVAFRVDEDWVFDDAAAADFNLGGATVVYNGVNDRATVAATLAQVNDPISFQEVLLNPAYKKVCIMQLSAELCQNLGGYVTVYHGGKVEAAE